MSRQAVVTRYTAYVLMVVAVAAAPPSPASWSARRVPERRARPGAARVEYPRVTRQGLKPTLVVEVENATATPAVPAVVLSSGYLEDCSSRA